MADDARLTVVVATLGRAYADRTVHDVGVSAAAAGVAVEVVVCWQGAAPPPAFPAAAPGADVRVLDVFPVGLSYARNRGLAAASAPLVAFVDDDEAVDPRWVGSLLEAFDTETDVAAVFGAVEPLDTDGIPYCEVTGERPQVFRRPSTPPWVVGTGGNMAFRRPDLERIGGFDVTLGAGAPGRAGEETDVIVRLLRGGRPVAFTPDAVVFHPSKSADEHLASRRPYGRGAGAVARRRRDPGLAARYTRDLMHSFVTGMRTRDGRRRTEALHTAAGFAAGLLRSAATGPSPAGALERMPDEVRRALGDAPVAARAGVWGTAPEFRYRAGDRALRVRPGPPADIPATGVVHRDALWTVGPA